MFGEVKMTAKHSVRALFTAILIALAAGSSTLPAQSTAALTPYTSCRFSDGLQIVTVDPLAPGITSRAVDTDSGPRQIDLNAGMRIMFAYTDTDFFAKVKAESLPKANYAQLKQYLLDNFQYLAHGNRINTTLTSPLNRFEVHGLDREKLSIRNHKPGSFKPWRITERFAIGFSAPTRAV